MGPLATFFVEKKASGLFEELLSVIDSSTRGTGLNLETARNYNTSLFLAVSTVKSAIFFLIGLLQF